MQLTMLFRSLVGFQCPRCQQVQPILPMARTARDGDGPPAQAWVQCPSCRARLRLTPDRQVTASVFDQLTWIGIALRFGLAVFVIVLFAIDAVIVALIWILVFVLGVLPIAVAAIYGRLWPYYNRVEHR